MYIVVGVAVMKFHYQASGIDLVPNKKFWNTLPGLIKVDSTVNAMLLISFLFRMVSYSRSVRACVARSQITPKCEIIVSRQELCHLTVAVLCICVDMKFTENTSGILRTG